MVKRRLIATLLTRNGRIVQSKNFKHTNVIGNAVTAVDFFNTWAVDEIVILDVSRDTNYRKSFFEMIEKLSDRCFVPLTVGGWITSIDDIRGLLKIGADKVVINTKAVREPTFVREAADTFGTQCIVVSLDVKKEDGGDYRVYVDRASEETKYTLEECALLMQQNGAGEIYLTSIDRDGLLGGYDIEALEKVTKALDIPVIASGGVGKWEHLVAGVNEGHAMAVSAANIFHFTEHSTKVAKEFMVEAGLDVRETVYFRVGHLRKPTYEMNYRV